MGRNKRQNRGKPARETGSGSSDNNNNNNNNNNLINKNNTINLEANLQELSNLTPGKDLDDDVKKPEVKLNFKQKFYRCFRRSAPLFPLASAILIPLMCFGIYAWAVASGHVEPVFPYVSDTGTLPPEAGIFSMLLDLAAILFVFTAFYRYRMIKYYIKNRVSDQKPEVLTHYDRINFFSFLFVLIACLSAVAVGNFRVSELINLHFIFAGLYFIPMFLSSCAQYILTRWLFRQRIESRPTTMAITVLLGGIGLTGTAIFSGISILIAGMDFARNTELRLKWNSEQAGYVWHVLGTASEWLTILSLSPMGLCFWNRMRKFEHFADV